MARALLVLPPRDFADRQYVLVRERLTAAGVAVDTATLDGPARSLAGQQVAPSVALEEVRASAYSAVVFIGGRGVHRVSTEPRLQRLAQMAAESGAVVGALGAATLLLARAGVLRGRLATGPTSLAGALRAAGATYDAAEVVWDAPILTARRWEGIATFAQRLVEEVQTRTPRRPPAGL